MRFLLLPAVFAFMSFSMLACSGDGNEENKKIDSAASHTEPDQEKTVKETFLQVKSGDTAGAEFIRNMQQYKSTKRFECGNLTAPNENIREYLIYLNGASPLITAETDNLAFYRANGKSGVFFILAVHFNNNTYKYYRGRVLCPDVCGLSDDPIAEPLLNCAVKYAPSPVGSKDDARDLIGEQTVGLVNKVNLNASIVKQIVATKPHFLHVVVDPLGPMWQTQIRSCGVDGKVSGTWYGKGNICIGTPCELFR